VRLRSGSVWPGVIAHAAYNGAGIAIAYATIQ
jgi:membrane protease YdiL (CAAX protease family)